MRSLLILSRLLDYPDESLWQAKSELLEAVDELTELNASQQAVLKRVIEWRISGRLLDAQADYGSLFDRGRSLSLLLFEHVHGESRDRGQAMVDLLDHYRKAGFDLNSNELPDHLPLFLEFLAQLSSEEAISWLESIAPILALLAARLHQRDSHYALLLDLLTQLSGSDASSENLQHQVGQEARDDTPAALDAVWEEEQVRFMATQQGDCGETRQHQQRFSGAVAPQYLNIEQAQPKNRERK
ncbi:nitrate reductase molybdenum cofactor assembly chaperone [Winslowiella sp. 2C04]|uniref:nitrate reductase molybdenum cofactor assembly chaperone n=1 Tax=Winslowiella sp. 2C04 TaxID=3416179 RepID=UPI003CEEAFC8